MTDQHRVTCNNAQHNHGAGIGPAASLSSSQAAGVAYGAGGGAGGIVTVVGPGGEGRASATVVSAAGGAGGAYAYRGSGGQPVAAAPKTFRERMLEVLPGHVHIDPRPARGWMATWSTPAGVWSVLDDDGPVTVTGPNVRIEDSRGDHDIARRVIGLLRTYRALPDTEPESATVVTATPINREALLAAASKAAAGLHGVQSRNPLIEQLAQSLSTFDDIGLPWTALPEQLQATYRRRASDTFAATRLMLIDQARPLASELSRMARRAHNRHPGSNGVDLTDCHLEPCVRRRQLVMRWSTNPWQV